jgi:hypothetical protein
MKSKEALSAFSVEDPGGEAFTGVMLCHLSNGYFNMIVYKFQKCDNRSIGTNGTYALRKSTTIG